VQELLAIGWQIVQWLQGCCCVCGWLVVHVLDGCRAVGVMGSNSSALLIAWRCFTDRVALYGVAAALEVAGSLLLAVLLQLGSTLRCCISTFMWDCGRVSIWMQRTAACLLFCCLSGCCQVCVAAATVLCLVYAASAVSVASLYACG
jgi:hypothetical protein